MATARDLIGRSHRLLGLVQPGDAIEEAAYQDDLDALNSMIDAWNTQRLFIVSVLEVSQSVSGLPITIGPSGTINMVRPVRMEGGAFVRLNSIDYPITWIGRSQYDTIAFKTQAGPLAFYGYYEPASPLGNIYLWPYPSASVELHLQVQVPVSSFATLDTDHVLVPGYRKALEYSLAEDIAPGRAPLTPEIVRTAANARRAIRRTNVEALPQSMLPTGPSPYAAFIAGL